MMGNFLTTLGNTPDEDRAMFENLGLNVERHADNAANPRPDNRSAWLDGETPASSDRLATAVAERPSSVQVRMWDPSTQLRFARKGHVPDRPDGAPNTTPSQRG
jgi:biotin synthase